MTEIQFDTVPEHYKKFVVFDVFGKQLGWVMHETEWQAISDWNRPRRTMQRPIATSAVEVR